MVFSVSFLNEKRAILVETDEAGELMEHRFYLIFLLMVLRKFTFGTCK